MSRMGQGDYCYMSNLDEHKLFMIVYGLMSSLPSTKSTISYLMLLIYPVKLKDLQMLLLHLD